MEKVIEKPYTRKELKEKMDEDGYITGRVAVPLSEIIDANFEDFLDILASKLVNSPCLMNINYNAVGIEDIKSGDANIIIEVSGDVSEIIDNK